MFAWWTRSAAGQTSQYPTGSKGFQFHSLSPLKRCLGGGKRDRSLNLASVWSGCTWHPMGAKSRAWDNEPSQNKNKCFDLILSKPHDPQMFPFTGVHIREDTAVKCTCCCTAHCPSAAIFHRQLIKRHQNEHRHYCRQGGGMVNINFSATGNFTFLVNLDTHLTHKRNATVELWFRSIAGETESLWRDTNGERLCSRSCQRWGKAKPTLPLSIFK